MNYDDKIDNYDDLKKEYMKHVNIGKQFMDNIDYNSTIKPIEPLGPLEGYGPAEGLQYSQGEAPYQHMNQNFVNNNYIQAKNPPTQNYSYKYDQKAEREREKEIIRKKQLEYQNFLNQQIEEKKQRLREEKERKIKEDLIYEQKYKEAFEREQEMYANRNFQDMNNMQNPQTNNKEIMQELINSHPGLEKILKKYQGISPQQNMSLNMNSGYQNTNNTLRQSNNEIYRTNTSPQINDNYYQNQDIYRVNTPQPNAVSNTFQNQNEIYRANTPQQEYYNNNYISQSQMPRTSQNFTNGFDTQMYQQVPGQMQSQNQQYGTYPPILEKMLDFFFQEQVKIINDYKKTIEELRNERDQAIYLNKANEEKLQAMERLQRDQDKLVNQIGFTPFDQKYKSRIENTLNSLIDKNDFKNRNENVPNANIENNYVNIGFKSKYENDNELMNSNSDKLASLITSTKFVKQNAERNLLETWVNDDDRRQLPLPTEQRYNDGLEYNANNNTNTNKIVSVGSKFAGNNTKERSASQMNMKELNDISSITQNNPCDDKSFTQEIEHSFKDEKELKKKIYGAQDSALSSPNKLNIVNERSNLQNLEEKNKEEIKGSFLSQKKVLMNKDNNIDYDYDIEKFEEVDLGDEDEKDYGKKSDDGLKFEIEEGQKTPKKKQTGTITPDESVEEDISNDKDESKTMIQDEVKFSKVPLIIQSELRQPQDSMKQVEPNDETDFKIENNEQIEHTKDNEIFENEDIIEEIEIEKENNNNDNQSFKQTSTFNMNRDISGIYKNNLSNNQSEYSSSNSKKQRNPFTFLGQSNAQNSRKDSENTEMMNKMTFFDDEDGEFRLKPSKPTPQNRFPHMSSKNIDNLNSVYEKMKKKKEKKDSVNQSNVNYFNKNDDNFLLNESLNTFTNNLNLKARKGSEASNNTSNVNQSNLVVGKEDEIMMKKVNQFTRVANEEIGQSQLSIFNKDKTIKNDMLKYS